MRVRYSLTCLAALPSSIFAASLTADYIAISNTLATYPLAIDGKDFSLLSQVFTVDVVANYSAPLNVLSGLPQVMTVLQQRWAISHSKQTCLN
jgi:hypothetical protein